MTFGKKLQLLRKQNGLSQEQLALQMAVSRQALSKWELDHSSPEIDNVIKLSKIFNVSTDYLLHNEIEISSQAKTNTTKPDKKHFGALKTILGIAFAFIGSIGMLIIGILSSVYPAVITYPVEVGKEDTAFARTGLPAFLEKYHIEWLFVLCGIALFSGLALFIYSIVQAKLKRKKDQPSIRL